MAEKPNTGNAPVSRSDSLPLLAPRSGSEEGSADEDHVEVENMDEQDSEAVESLRKALLNTSLSTSVASEGAGAGGGPDCSTADEKSTLTMNIRFFDEPAELSDAGSPLPTFPSSSSDYSSVLDNHPSSTQASTSRSGSGSGPSPSSGGWTTQEVDLNFNHPSAASDSEMPSTSRSSQQQQQQQEPGVGINWADPGFGRFTLRNRAVFPWRPTWPTDGKGLIEFLENFNLLPRTPGTPFRPFLQSDLRMYPHPELPEESSLLASADVLETASVETGRMAHDQVQPTSSLGVLTSNSGGTGGSGVGIRNSGSRSNAPHEYGTILAKVSEDEEDMDED